MADLFPPQTQWIWLSQAQRDKNSYACLRRAIELQEMPRAATVRVSADSRYELWINGQFVGHGPVRSWPSPWPVDEYDVRHLLRPGKNVVGVLVTHFGISTFQYIHDEAGLIAAIEVDGQRTVTDERWKCAAHDGYLWPVPRITCQQGWEEQFDARIAPGPAAEWSSPAFDDASWTPAKSLRRAGQPPHEDFELRDIPMLTLEPTAPVSIESVEVVRPADYTFALNPREFINATDKSANHILARMLLATFIHSDREQVIDLHQPHTRPFLPWKLNGKELGFDDRSLHKTDTGVAHARLKKGWNTLMVRLPEMEHHYWANLNIRTEHKVSFATTANQPADNVRAERPSPESAWLAIGPFPGPSGHVFDAIVIRPNAIDPRATIDRFNDIWNRGALSVEDLKESFVRPMRRDMVATRDVYATCVSDRVEPSITPRVDEPNAMTDDNADWTTIHPAHEGAGVRVLFDFGRETIGFHEFEIDAREGTVVDFHNFEFIQRDGRFNLNESMNNSFRYICRKGVQRYRTFLRRGLKYSWMTLRDFDSPVRVRMVRVLTSTYPQTSVGRFECSDPMLAEIWRVGVQSVRCCSEDTYTDCPTYEQTLWVGDARNEALVDLVANGDPRLSARCLRLVGRGLDRSPIAESQVPSGWQNLLPTWTFLWMRWAQEHYQLVGDRAFGQELLGFLERNIEGMKKQINNGQEGRGLFEMFAWNLFDWAPMDTPADGIVTHIQCLASLGLKQAAQLARELGDEAKARDWESSARGLAEAANKYLWSEEKGAYTDCIRADGSASPVFSQQTQVAALISGVAPAAGNYGDRAEKCRAIVHNPPEGFVRAGSPFFMFFLLEALVQEGRHEEMVETIRSYWGQQVDAGATTFWEMYQGPADGRRQTRSHCHGWSAAPTFFLTQYVLGVRPMEPGYATTLIAPKPGKLTWAQGAVPTPLGAVGCYWKNQAGAFEIRVNSPRGMKMRIELPVSGKIELAEGEGRIDGQVVISNSPRVRLVVRR